MWRADNRKTKRPEAARHHLRTVQFAAADGDIKSFINDIHHAITEIQIQLNIGITLTEFRQMRQQYAIADSRRGDA
ncbi:hypothetical protein SRABI106_04764 [Rahnella aquatilis]|nr:hypothetical protein SRABI106_04764 [Rahnella aquatilis]